MPKHRKLGTRTISGFTSIPCKPETHDRFARVSALLTLKTGKRPTADQLLNEMLGVYEASAQLPTPTPVSQ